MPEESYRLQSLIADIIEAESRGDAVDREGLIREHPEQADSLRAFFANHDSMKAGSNSKDVTLPPLNPNPAEDASLPPKRALSEEATLPPSKVPPGEEATLAARTSTTGGAANVGDKVRYFGDYELLEEIARGGMGVVYKARQVNLNRIVALKMILAGQLASEEDVRRFYTEAEAAANLDHPGIVPIFEVGQHQGQHYFSMGFIEGESLAQKVAGGPLPPREAAELVQKICEAMAFAHERGVIHRDLKPANILLDQSGQPKVTDFGLAKQMNVDSGLTGTGQILGTPSYMSPEQASGKVDEVGPLADVYALGAILYCLLTGRPPFQAANPMDTLLQVLEKEPIDPRRLNAHVEKDLATISMKCLRKDPARRYTSSTSMLDDLDRWINGKPIKAKPLSIVEHFTKWAEKHSASTLLIAMLMLPCLLFFYISVVQIAPKLVESISVIRLFSLLFYFPIICLLLGCIIGIRRRNFCRFSMRCLSNGLANSLFIALLLLLFTMIFAALEPLGAEHFVLLLQESVLAAETGTILCFVALTVFTIASVETEWQIVYRLLESFLVGIVFSLFWVTLLFTRGVQPFVIGAATIACTFLVFAVMRRLVARVDGEVEQRSNLAALQIGLRVAAPVAAILIVAFTISGQLTRTPNWSRIMGYSLPIISPTAQLLSKSPKNAGGWQLIYDVGDQAEVVRWHVFERLWHGSDGPELRRYFTVDVSVLDNERLEVLVSKEYPGGLVGAKNRLKWRGELEVCKMYSDHNENATKNPGSSDLRFFDAGPSLRTGVIRGEKIACELLQPGSSITEEMVKEAVIPESKFLEMDLVTVDRVHIFFSPYAAQKLNNAKSTGTLVLALDDELLSDRYFGQDYLTSSFLVTGYSELELDAIATTVNTGPLPGKIELRSEQSFAPHPF